MTYLALGTAPAATAIFLFLAGIAYWLPLGYGLWVSILALMHGLLTLVVLAAAVAMSIWSLVAWPPRTRGRIAGWCAMMAAAVGLAVKDADQWLVEDIGVVVGLMGAAALGFVSYLGVKGDGSLSIASPNREERSP